ncbi:type 1 glutamine amidotransferase domain-containing protein [Bacillus horti]|uniref:Protease I n=1 Tax=Caldalkalibacillus horti TaxID=77523 RepID=A0ABT9VZN3_9BACI|nr:type 1 glutamine amidotransferase domain-containing protein [Bacillus horti]MDQ0166461.1 protease I [Bacillus horti]
MSKKIAVLVTDMFEDSEYTEPVKAYKEAGHEVVNIESEAGKEVKGKNGETIKIDKALDQVKPEDFDALLLPGGFSPDLLRGKGGFGDFAKHFIEKDKPVFAICHGPQVLIDTHLLKGRNMTGFRSIKNDLINAGANFKDEEVVVCHNLVTSRTPDDLPAFNRESLNLLAK